MDHFARADDELAVAQRDGTLYRNFQGYSTHADCDLVAMGITSISKVGDSYCQNEKTMEAYENALDAGRLPVTRGIELSSDDLLRREIIMQLICHFKLDFAVIEQKYKLVFAEYFSQELNDLKSLQADGLLSVDATSMIASPSGKFLIRNICMVFDRYLRERREHRFSKVI
jgi:oxygen-independent coproporphyrinogen-3 oxidase